METRLYNLLLETSFNDLSILDKAIRFATFVHRQQYRKYEKDETGKPLPYIVHPKSVLNILKKWGEPEKLQAIGVLHDTVEDSKFPDITQNLIKKVFGNEMLGTILNLTHTKNIPYNSYILDLSKRDKNAFKVKMADMMSNIQTQPSKKQLIKYANGIQYLIDKNIKQIPIELQHIADKYSE